MARNRLAMRIEYQECRTWGHAWEDFIPHDKRPSGWGRRFSLRCTRCGTERHDVIDSLGELSTRSYDYPNDYQLAADERPSMTQLRLSLTSELRAAVQARNGNGHGKKAAPVKRRHRPRKLSRV